MKEKISPWLIVLGLLAAFLAGMATNDNNAALSNTPQFLSSSCI